MAKKVYRNPYRKSSVFTTRAEKQKRGKKGKTFKKIFLLSLLILFFALINYGLTTDSLRIKNIEIIGDKSFFDQANNSAEKYLEKNKFIIYKNNNYFLLKTEYLEKSIKEEIAEIKAVEIKKIFPDKLNIKIKERQAAIGWETNSEKYILDEEGYVLKEVSKDNGYSDIIFVKDTSGVEIEKNKQVVYPNFIVFIKNMSESLKKLKLNISSVEIEETTFIVNVYIDNSFKAIFNTTKGLEDQINKLKEALSYIGDNKSRLEYIDLTVKNKAIYKFK